MRVHIHFLLILFIAVVVSSMSFAQTSDFPTPIRYQYQSCVAKAKKQRMSAYVAWVPGFAHACALSAQPRNSAISFALQNCEKTMAIVRRTYKVSDKCRIAVDGGKVVDATYRRAWKILPLSVDVDIYDAESNKLQKAKAVFRDRVTHYRGLDPSRAQFRVVANGISLCTGVYEVLRRGPRIKYDATCFGEKFSGRSPVLNKVRRVEGVYVVVPKAVRLESGQSWMEIRF
ncbi:MAG: hypothetical protein AAFX07_02635 [Pseudomonadota bacterium]